MSYEEQYDARRPVTFLAEVKVSYLCCDVPGSVWTMEINLFAHGRPAENDVRAVSPI